MVQIYTIKTLMSSLLQKIRTTENIPVSGCKLYNEVNEISSSYQYIIEMIRFYH